MTIQKRQQLTLFVDPKDAGSIEQVRQQFNPIQFHLIQSHVTLCREDEIQNLDRVIANLLSLTGQKLVIEFGKATRFDNGKGVFLPTAITNAGFQHLRRQVLLGLDDNPRNHEAHITLLHPRNATCTDEIFKQIENIKLPAQLTFKTISLIEQVNGGPWNMLQEFELGT